MLSMPIRKKKRKNMKIIRSDKEYYGRYTQKKND